MSETKCFGIGLNKTGTKTLRSVLRTLGYNATSYDLDLMKKLGDGDRATAVSIAAGFDAFEDWPWPLLYKDLDLAYPGSKFILTTRLDAETWFNSLCGHCRRTGPTICHKIAYGHDTPWENKKAHTAFYLNHISSVVEYFRNRPEQLLCVCWERGDGWPEVCSFLDRAIPDLPFPHELSRRADWLCCRTVRRDE